VRTLATIEAELVEARKEMATLEGTPTEVYSRIVGYYRAVGNWNKGKREEYGERRLFAVGSALVGAARDTAIGNPSPAAVGAEARPAAPAAVGDPRVLLFVRPACPACPSAKIAAGKLGLPVDLVDADTEDGLAEAARRHVFSTPTAILLSGDGAELRRARDARAIASFADFAVAT